MKTFITNKKKIALLSGSFNPLHIGHVAIANYVVEYTDVDELWFVVSPHNPLKSTSDLLPERHRLEMLKIALSYYSLPFKICDIEMHMPKPSYTVDTLNKLKDLYADYSFSLIMGADSINDIERWKNYQFILNNYRIFVYPRIGYNTEALCEKYKVIYIDAPVMNISATFLRNALKEKHDISAFLPHGVYQYINKHNLYI